MNLNEFVKQIIAIEQDLIQQGLNTNKIEVCKGIYGDPIGIEEIYLEDDLVKDTMTTRYIVIN
jgi:hypothetical protein